MADLDTLLKDWKNVTGRLPWGAKRTFHQAFTLVSEGKIRLAYGADYRDGSPCLVNAVAQMLTTGGGKGIPSTHFREVVSKFDAINIQLASNEHGYVNDDGFVSPLAADILLRNFADISDEPESKATEVNESPEPYVERSDDDFMQDWMNAMELQATEDAALPGLDSELAPEFSDAPADRNT